MELVLPASDAAPWLAPALWLVVRATALLAAAVLAALALRRAPAAARHLAWGLAIGALLALPALSGVAPRWELPFVQAPQPQGIAGVGASDAAAGWAAALLVVWAAGAAAVLGRYLLAGAAVRLAAPGAREVADLGWRRRVASLAREVGVRGRVRLVFVPGAAMPMTWGITRPVVLLPQDAEGWSEARRRAVLLHELAHVARRDCLWQAVAALACALYWFHPGVWWAARRMRVEREQACDDRVLEAGTRPSEYAAHLLEVARASRPVAFSAAAAVAMARASQLEERVVAVLDAGRRRGAVGRPAAALACAAAAAALLPLAGARPEPGTPPPLPVLAVASAPAPAPRSASVAGAAAQVDVSRPGPPAAPSLHDPALAPEGPPAPRAVPRPPPPGTPAGRMAAAAPPSPSPAAPVRAAATVPEPRPSAASLPPAAPAPVAAGAADPGLRILGSLAEEDTALTAYPVVGAESM